MKLKKLLIAAICFTVVGSFTACGSSPGNEAESPAAESEKPPVISQKTEDAPPSDAAETPSDAAETPEIAIEEGSEAPAQSPAPVESELPEKSDKLAYGDIDLPQLTEIQKGEDIVKMTTSFGVVTIRLFPEYAPQGVDNFKSLAQDGYYNGTIFHRVAKDFVIQGGDPTGTGMGGSSKWGSPFKNEVSPALHHLYGAVCYANSGADTNGSQFYIVTAKSLSKEMEASLKELETTWNDVIDQDPEGNLVTKGDVYPEKIREKYLSEGGLPELDYRYTVFGQVIDGFDVLDKLAAVEFTPTESNPNEGIPIKEIKVEKMDVTTY